MPEILCYTSLTIFLSRPGGSKFYVSHKEFNSLKDILNILQVVVSGQYDGTGCHRKSGKML
jgi:hypothetical protein